MEEGEHKNRIEDIKRRLYDLEDSTSSRPHEGVLHPVSHKVPSSWQKNLAEEQNQEAKIPRKPKMSPFKKFFIGAIIFFVCAVAFSIYMFLNGGVSVSNDNIDINVLGNAFTKGGDELPLQIEIANHNNASLELADLIIEYPRGASDDPTDMVRLPRQSIGNIGKNSSVTENVKVTLFGEEQSIRNIKVTLEYHPEGSNAIFTKEKDYPVTISSAPLSLSIDAPDEVTSDQDISFKVTATLNTALPPNGTTMLQISYPNNFVFDSATPAPSYGSTIWNLSGLTQATPISIVVKGRLIGQDGDQQVFHIYAGTTSPKDQSIVNVVYNSLLKTITISKPFLEAHILVNDQDLPSYTASGGDTVNASIAWSNNLSNRITNGKIIVSFSGNVFDKNSVNPLEGFYDSANSQIIWDKNSIPELASIEPGASGEISFNFKPLSLIGLSNIKDPQMLLSVSIEGEQPSLGGTSASVNNFTKKVIKIISDFQLASSASYLSGSLPPKAETETQYTVAWSLSNSANNITGAEARSVLPIYVKWVGLAPGSNENVTYDDQTREVIWNIGQVRPNTGIDSNRQASFVISLTPSLSQVGSVPQLMKDVILTGSDVFTGTSIRSTRNPITTLLLSDPTFKSGQERVIQ